MPPVTTFPAHETYAKNLWPLGHGHALWCPEPSLLFGEVRLGDVGYLRDGHFLFIFNAMRNAADPVNQRGVPEDFEPFVPPDTPGTVQYCPDQITQQELHSRGMRSIAASAGISAGSTGASATASFRYQCTTTSGALLYLRDHGHKTFFDCDRHIKKYMSTHVTSWYQFTTRRLGIDLEEKDLIFISGFTKTSIWAEVAFHNSQSNGELVVNGGCLAPLISGELRVSTSQCVDAAVSSRIGPANRIAESNASGTDPDKYDQCIFLNYHKAKRRKLWRPRAMRAAAGPHDLPSNDSDNDSSASSLVSSLASDESAGMLRYNSFDPVGTLLDYIMLRSEAAVACASDRDLIALLPVQTIEDDLIDHLDLLSPFIEVDFHGFGHIEEAGTESPDHHPQRDSMSLGPGALDPSLPEDIVFDEDEFSRIVSSPTYDFSSQWSSTPFQIDDSELQMFSWSYQLPSPSRQPLSSRSYSPQLSDSDSISEHSPDATIRPKRRPAESAGAWEQENNLDKPAAAVIGSPRKLPPSAWQLFFADWMERREASGREKLNIAQAIREAGHDFAQLSAEEKESYRLGARALKEAQERAPTPALTPEGIKSENSYRARQRAAGKSRAKDPNAPKKPLSAYFKFLEHIRSDPARTEEIFGEETETTKRSVLAAGKWRSMPDEERKPFVAEAEKEKLEYEAARKLYEESGGGGAEHGITFSARPAPRLQSGPRPRRTGKDRASESETDVFGLDDFVPDMLSCNNPGGN
ncbi:hypothetical protein K466DRAFT_604210 [Polyporus arcularius HHB13444]|uniref:HMG box domain-containing protein n=1 Tax=Polyporus arcularius HHB13444 TaxID=1314778 RepID=A0A5C3NXI0_9APHY|nr:hypothetical protein K466DRAFT_604210 [Polyporus arcularius HHB13444]